MEKLIRYLNSVYKKMRIEKQILVIENKYGEYISVNISSNGDKHKTYSSYEKFKFAKDKFVEFKGVAAYVVHNHIQASPAPSFMDFENAKLILSWSISIDLPINDYMIYSDEGYFSFKEARLWSGAKKGKKESYVCVEELRVNVKNVDDICKIQTKIDDIINSGCEIIISGKKIMYSPSFPLEFIKKESENMEVNLIYITDSNLDDNLYYETIKKAISPVSIIQIDKQGSIDIVY